MRFAHGSGATGDVAHTGLIGVDRERSSGILVRRRAPWDDHDPALRDLPAAVLSWAARV